LLPPTLRATGKKHIDVAKKTLTAIELRTVHIHTCESKKEVTSSIHEIENARKLPATTVNTPVALNLPKQKYPDTRESSQRTTHQQPVPS
jgi:hypothetical protein